MARRNHDDDLLLEEDELTAAFLGEDSNSGSSMVTENIQTSAGNPADEQWDEDEASVPGQLAVDVPYNNTLL